MAAARTTKKKEPTVTVSVVVSKVLFVKDAEDSTTAVRITLNDSSDKLNITRVNDYYGTHKDNLTEWESCDDSVTLTKADIKAVVEALDA